MKRILMHILCTHGSSFSKKFTPHFVTLRKGYGGPSATITIIFLHSAGQSISLMYRNHYMITNLSMCSRINSFKSSSSELLLKSFLQPVKIDRFIAQICSSRWRTLDLWAKFFVDDDNDDFIIFATLGRYNYVVRHLKY